MIHEELADFGMARGDIGRISNGIFPECEREDFSLPNDKMGVRG
jgi:hypothetical protein